MTALSTEDQFMSDSIRINFITTREQHQWLLEAKFRDHISTSMRIRALVDLVREDPALAQRVSEKASEIARSSTTQ